MSKPVFDQPYGLRYKVDGVQMQLSWRPDFGAEKTAALQKAQFGGGSVSVTLPFAGRTLRVRIENADGIEQKDYRVYSAALDGTALPVAEGILRIPRAEIEALTADAIHEITVILHA